MESTDYLTGYYTAYDEEGRLLSRHGQVEYRTTMQYIHRYLCAGQKVLEIGAGTGRYSVALAEEGFDVTAVELVPHNLEVLKSKLYPDLRLNAKEGNALDLSFLPDASFDLTLLLGPLYHLYTQEEKRTALGEALRVTRPGGVVMAAYCIAEGSMIDYVFRQGHCFEVLKNGLMDPDTFELHSSPKELFELVRKQDIDLLMKPFAVTRLHYVATDGAANFMRETVDAMSDELFEVFMRYHFTCCEREDLVGATHHALDIFRKTE